MTGLLIPISLDLIVSIATPASVLVLAYQLWQRKKQFTTEFEDKLTSDYRDIIYEIPVDALLGNSDSEDYQDGLEDYYRYIDLTNDQISLDRKEESANLLGRIGRRGYQK